MLQQASPTHTVFDLCCYTAAHSLSLLFKWSQSIITTHLLTPKGW